MSNLEKNEATEELIKSTAKKLFFGEGKFNATTQEIADAAGINRTLINYYFRSRKNLLKIIFKDAQMEEAKKSKYLLNSDLPFKEKVAEFIDFSMELALEYPYLEIYLVTRISQGNIYEKKEHMDKLLPELYSLIQAEIDKGNIRKMKPIQFVLNFVSLINFPLFMRPLLQQSFELDDVAYHRLLQERKKIILDTLFIN